MLPIKFLTGKVMKFNSGCFDIIKKLRILTVRAGRLCYPPLPYPTIPTRAE